MDYEIYPIRKIKVVNYIKVLKKTGKDLQPYFEIHLDNGQNRKLFLKDLTKEQIIKYEELCKE